LIARFVRRRGASRSRAASYDLLRQHIERSLGKNQAVEFAQANRPHQHGAFRQIVARGDKESSFGDGAAPVARPPHPLQSNRNRTRRTDVAHQVHRSDVNAKFQRSGRHQNFYLTFFQLSLRFQAQLARQTPVMRRHVFLAQPLAQLMSNALGEPPRIHEHERRAVRIHQLYDALVNLVPHLVRRDRPQFGRRNLDSKIQRALMAYVDDHRIGPSFLRIGTAREEMRDFFDRLLGRRKPDAYRRAHGQRFQPLQRKRQMHAALVVGHGVNFVHNHGLDIAQDGAALLRRQQDVERLGRSDQNVRRTLQHEAAVFHQSVARPHRRADLRHQQPAFSRHLQNFSQRDFEIFLDVVAEGLERRNVENFGPVAKFARQGLAHQPVNASEEGGEGFARSGGSRDQRGVAGQNVGPALLLRFGRRGEMRGEPFLNQRMSPSERRRDCGRHGSDCKQNLEFRKMFAWAGSGSVFGGRYMIE